MKGPQYFAYRVAYHQYGIMNSWIFFHLSFGMLMKPLKEEVREGNFGTASVRK